MYPQILIHKNKTHCNPNNLDGIPSKFSLKTGHKNPFSQNKNNHLAW